MGETLKRPATDKEYALPGTGLRSSPDGATARRAATDEELAIDGNRAAGPAGATAPRA